MAASLSAQQVRAMGAEWPLTPGPDGRALLVRVLRSDAPLAPEQEMRAILVRVVGSDEKAAQALIPTGGDDYPQVQAAIEAGTEVRLGPGAFNLSAPLQVRDNCKIEGVAKFASVLHPVRGVSAINISVPGAGYSTVLEDFGIWYGGISNPTAPAAVTVTGETWEHIGFEARSISILNPSIGIAFGAASYWRLAGVYIQNSSSCAVLARNTHHGDSGDAAISDCWFFNPSITSGPTIGVLHLSGGGLKISNTKFNLFNQAYQLRLDPFVSTCDLLISNCSMESVGFSNPNAPILLQNPTGTGAFHSVSVVGNQFNGWGYQHGNPAYGGLINVVSDTGWLRKVVCPPGANVIN